MFLLLLCFVGCENKVSQQPQNLEVNSDRQRLSYAIGQQVGTELRKQGTQIDSDVFKAGVDHALAGKTSLLKTEEIQAAINKNRSQLQQKRDAERIAEQQRGEIFLKKNKLRAEVKQTASGLQYELIRAGAGGKVGALGTKARVRIHHQAKLIDGTVIEDSKTVQSEPLEYSIDQVLPGWKEGLSMMNIGSLMRFYLSPSLAYGDAPPEPIPVGAVIIYEIELFEMNLNRK